MTAVFFILVFRGVWIVPPEFLNKLRKTRPHRETSTNPPLPNISEWEHKHKTTGTFSLSLSLSQKFAHFGPDTYTNLGRRRWEEVERVCVCVCKCVCDTEKALIQKKGYGCVILSSQNIKLNSCRHWMGLSTLREAQATSQREKKTWFKNIKHTSTFTILATVHWFWFVTVHKYKHTLPHANPLPMMWVW